MTQAPELGRRPDRAGQVTLKRALVGRPRASDELDRTLLSKTLALPVFASDPLSSVAYATEAALAVLVAASLTAAHLVFPISVGIAVLLAIVVLSYRQTVHAYATSGGAYVVARDNLGRYPSLLAAAALLVDYVLTVAVSVAAGVLALTSAAPSLAGHRVELSLLCIVALTVVNLRGVRESGILFALPTYAFVAAMFVLVIVGAGTCAAGTCPRAVVPDPVPAGIGAVSLVVVLRAFASGAAALTGVEAISNGVGAFRPPKARNAATTLAVMGAIAIALFLGVSWLAVQTGARPSESASVLSEIARGVFPAGSWTGFMYYAVQGLTLGILVLAANTSYQGFPRLTAVLARDGYAPRQFVNLGDRLVLSNGILVLAGIAALLIWVFHADVDSLIHLYVIGVFTAFTLSQAGMVRHWARTGEPGWRHRAAINGLGAAATGIVTLLVVQTKFLEGAWLVTVAIPVLIGVLLVVHRHYRTVGRRLRASTSAAPHGRVASNEVVVVASGLDRAATLAAWYAREIQSSSVRAVHAGGTPHPGWWRLAGVPLEELDVRHGRVDAVLDRVWALPHGDGRFVTVVVPEQFERRSLFEAVVRRRTAFSLKLRLLREPGVVVTDVPVVGAFELPAPAERRLVGRVLVSGVQAASLRALDYAASLGLPDTKAVFFAFDAAEAERIQADWERAAPPVPLEIVEAPYRDLGEPLLHHLRDLTADPNVLVSVVMPELVFSGWRALLHNQRALYVKRLLLFEPRVILSSVPYQLV